MARRFVADLRPGERIEDQVFLIRSKDLRTTTQGGLYVHAVLMDKSGQLLSRIWQATEEMFREMPEGGFLRFKGRTENYKGNLQFIIDGFDPVDPDSVDLADFVPATDRDIDEMWKRLVDIIESIQHPALQSLLAAFLRDEQLMARFRRAPAAVAMHHAYLGGLLEHTLALLELASVVIPRYPKLSVDLVLAGLFLHDIGKAVELSFDVNIGYSDDGQLIGHIAQGVLILQKKADAVATATGNPFPEQLLWALQHIVLSHHGRYEFGSPKLPAFPEAVAIHHLDNLDAKINMFLSCIERDKDPVSSWTEYQRALETKVYKPSFMTLTGSTDLGRD